MTRSGRSPGSRVLVLLRLPRPCTRKAQWHLGERLTADSCGGSSGFDCAEANRTEFPLGRSTRPAHLNGSIGSVSADPCQRKSRRYSIPGYTSCERVASQQHLSRTNLRCCTLNWTDCLLVPGAVVMIRIIRLCALRLLVRYLERCVSFRRHGCLSDRRDSRNALSARRAAPHRRRVGLCGTSAPGETRKAESVGVHDGEHCEDPCARS